MRERSRGEARLSARERADEKMLFSTVLGQKNAILAYVTVELY
jgi:hypothetical protein